MSRTDTTYEYVDAARVLLDELTKSVSDELQKKYALLSYIDIDSICSIFDELACGYGCKCVCKLSVTSAEQEFIVPYLRCIFHCRVQYGIGEPIHHTVTAIISKSDSGLPIRKLNSLRLCTRVEVDDDIPPAQCTVKLSHRVVSYDCTQIKGDLNICTAVCRSLKAYVPRHLDFIKQYRTQKSD